MEHFHVETISSRVKNCTLVTLLCTSNFLMLPEHPARQTSCLFDTQKTRIFMTNEISTFPGESEM